MGIVKDGESESKTKPQSQSRSRENWNEIAELEQANALYSLLESRYAKKACSSRPPAIFYLTLIIFIISILLISYTNSYNWRQYPIANSLMTPASNPTYYTDLIRELEEAPKRSWWARLINRWKGGIRFK
jgi:cytochrome b pre-mRNA-processing protein 6